MANNSKPVPVPSYFVWITYTRVENVLQNNWFPNTDVPLIGTPGGLNTLANLDRGIQICYVTGSSTVSFMT